MGNLRDSKQGKAAGEAVGRPGALAPPARPIVPFQCLIPFGR
jgi:hypothetical protein